MWPTSATRMFPAPCSGFGNLPAMINADVHSGEDVILTASGPGSERVRGQMDNTEVFRVIAEALGLGSADSEPKRDGGRPASAVSAAIDEPSQRGAPRLPRSRLAVTRRYAARVVSERRSSARCRPLRACRRFRSRRCRRRPRRRSTVETAAQEIVGLATRPAPCCRRGCCGRRAVAVPARHRQPWLAPRCLPAPEHGDTDVSRGIKLAASARIHGRAAAAPRLWADRRSVAGKLRIVQQPRLLSRRDDHGPGHPNGDRLFPRPNRGAARSYSLDRLVGGRLGIARGREPKSARRVRRHQFRRRARRRASAESATARRNV